MAEKHKMFPFLPNLRDRDCSWESPVDEDGVQVSSSLNASGQELPDPTPMAPPIGMDARPSLADFVHRMIRQEVSRAARAAEMESFDEADDFDIEDDPIDELTPYERHFEGKPVPEDWPMYYNERTGMYGQLPPDQAAPDGFVRLEREKQLPKGWNLPNRAPCGGAGGAEPPTAKPPGGASKAPPDPGEPTT